MFVVVVVVVLFFCFFTAHHCPEITQSFTKNKTNMGRHKQEIDEDDAIYRKDTI